MLMNFHLLKMSPIFVGSQVSCLAKYQKVLLECSFDWKNLLNFNCHAMKYTTFITLMYRKVSCSTGFFCSKKNQSLLFEVFIFTLKLAIFNTVYFRVTIINNKSVCNSFPGFSDQNLGLKWYALVLKQTTLGQLT